MKKPIPIVEPMYRFTEIRNFILEEYKIDLYDVTGYQKIYNDLQTKYNGLHPNLKNKYTFGSWLKQNGELRDGVTINIMSILQNLPECYRDIVKLVPETLSKEYDSVIPILKKEFGEIICINIYQ